MGWRHWTFRVIGNGRYHASPLLDNPQQTKQIKLKDSLGIENGVSLLCVLYVKPMTVQMIRAIRASWSNKYYTLTIQRTLQDESKFSTPVHYDYYLGFNFGEIYLVVNIYPLLLRVLFWRDIPWLPMPIHSTSQKPPDRESKCYPVIQEMCCKSSPCAAQPIDILISWNNIL